jgi:spore protease
LSSEAHGIRFREYQREKTTVSHLEILTEEGAEILGKAKGTYITIDVGRVWLLEDVAFERAARLIAEELSLLTREQTESLDGILVAGLGNRMITSDAIGPLAVESITVTRHIKELDPSLFASLQSHSLAAIAPGVVGQTGIETAELIRSAVEAISPSVLICIDALAARSVDRLAVTVQLSNTGIAPGSGIGNHRQAINRDFLGIPVIANAQ